MQSRARLFPPTALARWNDVVTRAAAEIEAEAPSKCVTPEQMAAPPCRGSGWRAMLAGLRDHGARAQLAGVQQAVNRLPYRPDDKNWGSRDFWETPADMFARGGDCEGFALTKYFALRALGFEEAALRFVIVWDKEDHEHHAIVLVRLQAETWVLDNKFVFPVPVAALLKRYALIWSATGRSAALAADAFGDANGRLRLSRDGKTLVIRAKPRARLAWRQFR